MKKLKVYWIPQVPMSPFEKEVSSLSEAKLLLDTLADYDAFQYENKIKPDYCNAGGLLEWSNGEWSDWEYDDGRLIEDLTEAEIRSVDTYQGILNFAEATKKAFENRDR